MVDVIIFAFHMVEMKGNVAVRLVIREVIPRQSVFNTIRMLLFPNYKWQEDLTLMKTKKLWFRSLGKVYSNVLLFNITFS